MKVNNMLEEIHTDFSDFPNIVRQGKTYEERKELLWRCYAVNPKKSDLEKLTLQDIIWYIEDTDDFFNEDEKYLNECIKLILELKEVK